MAGKTTEMRTVKQVIILHEQGLSNRSIVTHCDLNKEKVNRYIRKLQALGLPTKTLLDMDDPELEAKFFAGNPANVYRRLSFCLDDLLKSPGRVSSVPGARQP